MAVLWQPGDRVIYTPPVLDAMWPWIAAIDRVDGETIWIIPFEGADSSAYPADRADLMAYGEEAIADCRKLADEIEVVTAEARTRISLMGRAKLAAIVARY